MYAATIGCIVNRSDSKWMQLAGRRSTNGIREEVALLHNSVMFPDSLSAMVTDVREIVTEKRRLLKTA